MNNPCNSYKTDIDHRERLDPAAQDALGAHLKDCEECSEYADLARITDTVAHRLRDKFTRSQPDIAYQQLLSRSAGEKRTTVVAIVGAVTSLMALIWFASKDGGFNAGSLVLLAWFIGTTAVAWWSAKRSQRYLSYNQTTEFLQSWRRDLVNKLRVSSIVASLVAAEIVLSIILLVVNGWPQEGAPILLGIGLILGTGVLYTFVVEVPLVRKELDLIRE